MHVLGGVVSGHDANVVGGPRRMNSEAASRNSVRLFVSARCDNANDKQASHAGEGQIMSLS
eukprot:2170664-Pleurochrysis_carterae.AAC.1